MRKYRSIKILLAALTLIGAPVIVQLTAVSHAQAAKVSAAKAKTPSKAQKSEKAKPSKVVRSSTPETVVNEKVAKILQDLKGRPPRQAVYTTTAVSLPLFPDRQEWLQAVYANKLVDASWATSQLSDKKLFYEVVRRELGDRATEFLPKTKGLREFLVSASLVDSEGRLRADGDVIEAALFREFPAGFVARPAVGVAPSETGRGLFAETDLFVQELLKPQNALYRPEHRKLPVRSTVLDDIASGEAIVLQEDVISAANSRAPLKIKDRSHAWRELRIHTYEGQVLRDATPTTWVSGVRFTPSEIESAQSFVQKFLSLLPTSLLTRQAWSFDVLVLDNGERRIVDLVTNRGKRVGWSTYLDQPRVLGAYTRRFEEIAGVHFAGLGGAMLRHNWGHYFGFWSLRIDRSRPGLDRVMAWIPPWP